MFNIYYSNDIYKLSSKLIEIEKNDFKFSNKEIITQTPGMKKWLTLDLAKKNSVLINTNYYTPNSFLDNIYNGIFNNETNTNIFDQAYLPWIIYNNLGDINSDNKIFNKYISNNDLKWELANKLSDVFDQYIIFREDLLINWINDINWVQDDKDSFKNIFNRYGHNLKDENKRIINSNEEWQKKVFNKIIKDSNTYGNLTKKYKLLFILLNDKQKKIFLKNKSLRKLIDYENINFDKIDLKYLSKFNNIHLFGISTIPFYFLDLFYLLSKHININIYIINPSPEYWFDMKSEKQKLNQKIRTEKKKIDYIDLYEKEFDMMTLDYYEEGNSLLLDNGRLGKEFFYMLSFYDDNNNFDYIYNLDSDIKMSSKTLLGKIKNSLYSSKEISLGEDHLNNDNSIKINICHSKKREVEVLANEILNLLEHNKEYSFEDICVMIPDIDEYLPYIDTVFSKLELSHIEYSISDNLSYSTSKNIMVFLKILDLYNTDFDYLSLKNILIEQSIYTSFDLNKEDIHTFLYYLKDAGFRRGIDDEKNTFANLDYSLNKIFYSLLIGNNNIYDETYYTKDNYDLNQFEKFNNFVRMINTFKNLYKNFSSNKTFKKWFKLLKNLVNEVFLSIKGEREFLYIINVITRLRNCNDIVSSEIEYNFNQIKYYIESYIKSNSSKSGFLRNGITICSLIPMRSIPFKTIFLVGMNDISFPRSKPNLSFNIIENHWRLGDRKINISDRYLFLEILSSVKEKLIISYVGRNIKDNSDISPSIIIQEFMDYIEKNNGNLNIINHKIHGFDKIYYQKNNNKYYNYFKYEKKKINLIKNKESYFFPTNISLELDDILQYFKTPEKYILSRKYNIKYPYDKNELNYKYEKWEIDYLTNYKLFTDLEKLVLNYFLENKLRFTNDKIINELDFNVIYNELLLNNKLQEKFKGHYDLYKIINKIINNYKKLFIWKEYENSENIEKHKDLFLSKKISFDNYHIEVSKLFNDLYFDINNDSFVFYDYKESQNYIKHSLNAIIKVSFLHLFYPNKSILYYLITKSKLYKIDNNDIIDFETIIKKFVQYYNNDILYGNKILKQFFTESFEIRAAYNNAKKSYEEIVQQINTDISKLSKEERNYDNHKDEISVFQNIYFKKSLDIMDYEATHIYGELNNFFKTFFTKKKIKSIGLEAKGVKLV